MTGMPTTGKAAIVRSHIFTPRQKDTQLVSLAEAIRTVVSHQTATGTCPSDASILPNRSQLRNGDKRG